LLAKVAQTRWRELLISAWSLLFAVRILPYLSLAASPPAFSETAQLFFPLFSYLFYFAFGITYRLHFNNLRQQILRLQGLLPVAVVLFAVLTLIDVELFSRLDIDRNGIWPDHAHMSLFTEGYALAIILSFLTFDRIPLPATRMLITLGSAVYGVYLLHPVLLEYLARAVHRLAPWFLAYPIAFVLFLVAGGVTLPLLLMSAVKRSPLRRYYRHLFG
jgi:surface polysaccharide O-acyltransferase-like enzyme